MLEKEMKEWEKVNNINSVEDIIRLLEWRSQLRRGSMTAIQASKEVFARPDSIVSFELSELGHESKGIKGCKSVSNIKKGTSLDGISGEMSSSYTIQEEEKKAINRKVDERILYDSKDMKNSIYDEIKPTKVVHEMRKTKQKFNLMSTSSTLEKFS